MEEFIAYAEEQSQFYATDHVIIAMGQDFSYQQADMWYKNLDKLIE